MDGYTIVNAVEEPKLLEITDPMTSTVWPEFMLHDPVANKYWGKLFEYFPAYQFGLFDRQSGELAVVANSIPLYLDIALEDIPDEGWDWVLEKGMLDYEQKIKPNIQSALAIAIKKDYQGQGLSRGVIGLMKAVGKKDTLTQLIAPVRPNQKTIYPLTDIDSYIQWQNEKGEPFDAWIRVHCSLGGTIVKVCPKSMYIPGTIAEWEMWTGLSFPESGEYIIPGALNAVTIDLEKNRGVYIEPNVLIVHQ